MFEWEILMSPCEMKWMIESKGGALYNTYARVKSNFSRAL